MANRTIVTLIDPDAYTTTEVDHICGVWDELAGRKGKHPGLPVHLESECHLLAGLVPYSEDVRCSVCGQRVNPHFGFGQHEHCAWLERDGTRVYARPVVTYRAADGEIEITNA